MYRMNDGYVYVYKVLDKKTLSGLPLCPLEGVCRFCFEYISIDMEDYNIAQQEGIKVETRIRILQNRSITSKNMVNISGNFYRVWRVRHSVNRKNIPITDITLFATTEKVEVQV